MGPAVQISSRSKVDDGLLLAVDALLHAECTQVETTRKGRVFDVWVDDRPFHVWIEGADDSTEPIPSGMSSAIWISAGGNQPTDRELMLRLAGRIALEVGGEVGPID